MHAPTLKSVSGPASPFRTCSYEGYNTRVIFGMMENRMETSTRGYTRGYIGRYSILP